MGFLTKDKKKKEPKPQSISTEQKGQKHGVLAKAQEDQKKQKASFPQKEKR